MLMKAYSFSDKPLAPLTFSWNQLANSELSGGVVEPG
jgi:hypothetical protein